MIKPFNMCVSACILRSVAVSSQPAVSEPEEEEVFEAAKEDPSPPETLPTHTSPDPSFDTEVRSWMWMSVYGFQDAFCGWSQCVFMY